LDSIPLTGLAFCGYQDIGAIPVPLSFILGSAKRHCMTEAACASACWQELMGNEDGAGIMCAVVAALPDKFIAARPVGLPEQLAAASATASRGASRGASPGASW
jgi:hypothetical protein